MPAIYYVEQTIHGCNNDELTLFVRWNGARMVVNVDRNLSSSVVENLLIDKYSSACLQDDEDEEDAVRDQLLDAIHEAGHALLDQLAPPSTPESSNLHSVLFPQQFSFNLVTVGGELKLLLEGSHQLEKSEIPGNGYKRAVPIAGFTLPNAESRPIQFQLEVKEGLEFPRQTSGSLRSFLAMGTSLMCPWMGVRCAPRLGKTLMAEHYRGNSIVSLGFLPSTLRKPHESMCQIY